MLRSIRHFSRSSKFNKHHWRNKFKQKKIEAHIEQGFALIKKGDNYSLEAERYFNKARALDKNNQYKKIIDHGICEVAITHGIACASDPTRPMRQYCFEPDKED